METVNHYNGYYTTLKIGCQYAMSKFLDEIGFSHAWQAIKSYIESKSTNITATVSNTTGTPSVTRTESNGTINFAFSGLKGDKGDTGAIGPQGVGFEVYLDQETEIGTWMGKPLYRRVVTGKITALQTEIKLGDIPSTAKVVNMSGIIEDSTSYAPITSFDVALYSYVGSGGVYIFVKDNPNLPVGSTALISVEYTKN